MKKILIFGAGSIGNHMSKACISIGWQVYITDISNKALERMRNQIYPSRYGRWDNNIIQLSFDNVFKLKNKFDIIIIGTPPSTHYKIYSLCKKNLNYNKVLIEKPISNYLDKKIFNLNKDINNSLIFCGYNHTVNPSLEYFFKNLKKLKNNIENVFIDWKEGWSGILGAHPWLKDEFDSYLGDYKKGGGALQEHSHGLHLLVCILKILRVNKHQNLYKKIYYKKKGKIKYDYFSSLTFEAKKIFFNYETDLITFPAEKKIYVGLKNGYIKWTCNIIKNQDLVIIKYKNKEIVQKFKKTRSSEFVNELIHLDKIKTKKQYEKSNINIYNALQTLTFTQETFKR